MKKLPIGIQTFTKIIEERCYYVDKTHIALKLIQKGNYYFLSRPRRFGKSLFLDTLSEIFLGNKELFKGLYIYDKYDFPSHPIIRISFGSGDYSTSIEQAERKIAWILERNQKELNIKCEKKQNDECFAEILEKAFEKYDQQVVILIDEYDKPILDNITNKEMATKARNILKNFYGIIKDNDRYIRFVFITGVSKFSKLNLFSGLNNLEDITIDENYAEICGYTHDDLLTVFKDIIKGANLDLVKRWYNGYNYFGKPLYNPFDILLFLSKNHDFRNYWWQTGNPSFLIEKLKQENYYIPELENDLISEEALEAFDVEYIDLRALLWQTGYLTIKDKLTDETGSNMYRLSIPNLEIQFSLNRLFIDYLTNQRMEKTRYELNMKKALRENNFDALIGHLKTIFSTIPYQNYANNIISKYEGYYSSIIFVYLMALGYEVIPEDITNKGRIDLTLKMRDKIIIIEFKVDKKQEKPIKQIKERRYYEKYLNENKEICLIGIVFDSKERNIGEWEIEKVNRG